MGAFISQRRGAKVGSSRPITIREQLTQRQRALVMRTWTLFIQLEAEPGVQIFRRIFARCPQAKIPFLVEYEGRVNVVLKTKVSDAGPMMKRAASEPKPKPMSEKDEMIERIRRSGHANSFVHGMTRLVAGISEERVATCDEHILALGSKHNFISDFSASYMPNFCEAILDTLRVSISRRVFTAESEHAFNLFLEYTSEKMLEGYYQHPLCSAVRNKKT